MSHTPHELAEEFPDKVQQIHDLKVSDAHQIHVRHMTDACQIHVRYVSDTGQI